MGGRIFGVGTFVSLAGLVTACSGGSGSTPGYNDNYDSLAGSREPSGSARERPTINNERPPIGNERPRTNQIEPPPGLKVGGGQSTIQSGSFKCAGAYVCVGSDGDKDNITLSESGGKCRASGITLEPDGTATITVNGRTQVLGNWSVSGDTLTFKSAQTTSTCTPRTTTSGSGSDGQGG